MGPSIPWFRETELFTSGAEGYHTFRIPALVVSTDGTLLAFCEARKYAHDDWGEINIVLKRSFDSGTSWQRMQIVAAEEGDITIGNPAPVVDRDTGKVWLAFCRNNDQVFVTNSADDGATWSTPEEITRDAKLPAWTWYATGPGHGIQLKSGRLVIPADHYDGVRQLWPFYHSHIIYSDDHGSSWKIGGITGAGTNECEVIETSGGALYMTMRSAKDGLGHRHGAWSQDGGVTWSEVMHEEHLIDANCQASIVRLTDENSHDKNRVLFSNPASTERTTMTVRMSYDECRTWDVSKMLHRGPSSYSDLAVAPDMTACCLYERGNIHRRECIRLAQFNIEWLTDGVDSLKPKSG